MKTLDTAIQPSPKVKLTNKRLLIEVLLFFIILIAVYLMLALISFEPADPGWSQTAWHEPIKNWGGMIGAFLSDVFLQFLGFVAYSIPVLIIMFCVQAMLYFYWHANQTVNYFTLSLKVIGAMAFIFSVTGFFALNVQDHEQFKAGGILGDIVSGEMLPLFNHIGSSVILFAIFLACFTLITGLSWVYFAEKLGAFMVMITTPLLARLVSFFKRTPNETYGEYEDEEQEYGKDNTEPSINLNPEPILSQDTSSSPNMTTRDEEKSPLLSTEELISRSRNMKQNNAQFADMIIDENNSNIKNVANTKITTSANNLSANDDEFTALIDENTPPSISNHDNSQPFENFAINPDYYSPIALKTPPVKNDSDTISLPNEEKNENEIVITDTAVITNHSSRADNNRVSSAETKPEMEPITAENIHDSLIHPFLQHDHKPLKKPTTPLPLLDLLTAPPVKQIDVDHNALQATAQLIERCLADYRVKARVVDYLPGPVITRFELELAPGVKAARISTLDRDLARSLSMPSVRVVEVIPGKPYVGIELPNKHRQTVYLREVLDSPQFKDAKSPLTVALGKDIAGQSVVADLAKMPHLLVAGTTGSGKSVGVNAMILSILYKSQPEDAKFIMIDPKMLELSVYEGIPHLLTDVVTDMKDAANALNWCVNEMERRYRLMSALGVRNIAGYNEKIKLAEEMGRPIQDPLWRPGDSMDIEMPMLEKLPYIVVMVDEFADLIMAVGKKVEELIARLAQKARAAGIHLVLATQRPSVDVITGLIKANIPTRIAFTVSSKIDSRTILDQMGAESLLGMGDMLYLAPNSSIPIRVHGAFVRDEEVHSVVQDWKAREIPTNYIDNITTGSDDDTNNANNIDEELDPLFDQVVQFVIDKRRASISSVQRQFRIGYNRAARIVEQMENQGIVSTPSHNGNREVLSPRVEQDY